MTPSRLIAWRAPFVDLRQHGLFDAAALVQFVRLDRPVQLWT
jgi:hypothetical protein